MRHVERLPDKVSNAAAKARARDVLNAALDGTLVVQKSAKKATHRLHGALDEYLNWSETNRPRTLSSRKSIVRILKAGVSDVPLDELVPFTIERYKRARANGEVVIRDEDGEKSNRKATIAPATINREVTLLKHACKLAADWGWMDPGKAAAVHSMKLLKESPGRVRHLSVEEEQKILAALPEGVRRIVLVANMTGMRRGEVVALKRSAVDLVNRAITLTRTKSNRVRHIPIGSDLAVLLHDTLAASTAAIDALDTKYGRNAERDAARAFVFLSSNGTPYNLDAVTRAFARAAKRAGVEDIRLHDTRHTFATRVRRQGHGIDVIADLLGHAQITTSSRYTHVGMEQLRAAVAGLKAPSVRLAAVE